MHVKEGRFRGESERERAGHVRGGVVGVHSLGHEHED